MVNTVQKDPQGSTVAHGAHPISAYNGKVRSAELNTFTLRDREIHTKKEKEKRAIENRVHVKLIRSPTPNRSEDMPSHSVI
jgi:hypothetical protein